MLTLSLPMMMAGTVDYVNFICCYLIRRRAGLEKLF
jgi:hypothetical protein